MGDHDSEPKPPAPDLLFDEFLKDTYHLFVIASVFGVLSVYLASVRAQGVYREALSPLLDIAIIASLLLVVIVSLYIDFMFVFIYTDALTAPMAIFTRKSVLFAFFLLPFNVLVGSVVGLLARIDQLIHFVIGLLAFIGGIFVYGAVAQGIFTVFEWRVEADGYGTFLGLAAFALYNILLVVSAFLILSALMQPLGGVDELRVLVSSGISTTALLAFGFAIAVMPVIMLLGFLLYMFYYKIG